MHEEPRGRRRLLFVCVAFLFSVSCHRHHGSCGLTLDPYGGYAMLVVSGAGASGVGQFVSAISPDDPVTIPDANDSCGQGDFLGGRTLTILGVGSALTFTSGTSQLVAIEDTAGSYSGTLAGSAPTDADYDVAISGAGAVPAGILGSLHVPAPIGFVQPPIVPGQDLDLTFTGGDGAQVVTVFATSANRSIRYACAAKPDGAFALPADVTAAIGSGGSIVLQAEDRKRVELQGRDVLLLGATSSD
jgi:hypothetical protein